MAKLSTEDRDKIVAQALREILWARKYKQGKVKNWQINEQMYYGVKLAQPEARANVQLGRMQGYVHDILSKIRRPLVFKFKKTKNSQLERVKLLNALREFDRKNDHWDIKDLAGKKQMVIYGREIFSYSADSMDGRYRTHLENIDVYDFLVDPSAGGLDLEQGLYMGDYGTVLLRDQLEDGMKSGEYSKQETQNILDGVGNNTEVNQEETNKLTRMYGQNTIGKKELQNQDKFKFWRWFTTFKGERYYLVLQERAGKAIVVDPLEEHFTPNEMFPRGAWPYWTAAAFIDMTEFWSPSYCDYVREVFMAQDVSIDQMLDNAEAINKPMKIVNTDAIENLAELKYRRDGVIRTKNQIDADKAIQYVKTIPIDTPMKVFQQLEEIAQANSGVTKEARGTADPDGKVAIYQGNKAEIADRFGLLDMSYSFGYERFAHLYEIGVRDHLTKKIAIDVVGPDGVETVEVSKRDIFKKKDEHFAIAVESSSDEMMQATAEKVARHNFLQKFIDADNAAAIQHPTATPLINHKKAFEMLAAMFEMKPEDIAELLDVSEYSISQIMAEADRDIESLEMGEKIKPNPAANTDYMQRIKDWLTEHIEDLDEPTKKRFFAYMDSLGGTVAVNAARDVMKHYIKALDGIAAGVELPPDLNLKSIAGGAMPGNPIAPAPAAPAPAPAAPVGLPQQPAQPPAALPAAPAPIQ